MPGLDLVREREATVIEALSQQYNIGKRICGSPLALTIVDGALTESTSRTRQSFGKGGLTVNRQNNHSRQNSLQDGPQNIEHIASQPDNNEHDRKSISRASPEVLDDLR